MSGDVCLHRDPSLDKIEISILAGNPLDCPTPRFEDNHRETSKNDLAVSARP